MSSPSPKIECLRAFLLEALELGKELGDGRDPATGVLSFKTRGLYNLENIYSKCDLDSSLFWGLLEKFKEEGFILGYRSIPLFRSATELDNADSTGVDIYFSATQKAEPELFAEITYDEHLREIWYNNHIRFTQPRFNSESHQFIEYVSRNPDITITTEELQKHIKPTGSTYTTPRQILRDLGFKRSLREMFFPGASARAVYFRPKITRSEFEKLGISQESLDEDLSDSAKKRKE